MSFTTQSFCNCNILVALLSIHQTPNSTESVSSVSKYSNFALTSMNFMAHEGALEKGYSGIKGNLDANRSDTEMTLVLSGYF